MKGDGRIGVASTVIEALGSTSLVQADNNLYLNTISSGFCPTLQCGRTATLFPYTTLFRSVAVEQIAGGYQVALKYAAGNQFSIWNTDSSGNFISYAVYAEIRRALESTAVTS